MIVYLRLTNDKIAGMVDLHIYLPARHATKLRVRKRVTQSFTWEFDPYRPFATFYHWPPWVGWWKNSGNKVHGEAGWSGGELAVAWDKGERHVIKMKTGAQLFTGKRVALISLKDKSVTKLKVSEIKEL